MSEFVIEAIEEKLYKENNPDYIRSKIEEYKNLIKELGNSLTSEKIQPEINEIIKKHYDSWEQRESLNAPFHKIGFWIDEIVKPELNKIGWRGTTTDIVKLFKSYK